MKKEQTVRTEICLRLNISRSIILTSLDLSGMFFNRIPRTYNSISWGYFQILFRASTKNFFSSTFKKFKSSTSKANAHWKDFQSLLYANIGKIFHCKSFLWVWFFFFFHRNQVQSSCLRFRFSFLAQLLTQD